MYPILYCGGVQLPSPTQISEGNTKVWSENTGRSVTAKMIGDIKALKNKLTITWEVLTLEQVNLLKQCFNDINNPFKGFRFDWNDGTNYCSFQHYSGDLSLEFLGCVDGVPYWRTVSVDIIEQ